MFVNDTSVRHLVAFIATLLTLLAFFAGYIAGGYGWWWVAFGCLVIYGLIYKLVNI